VLLVGATGNAPGLPGVAGAEVFCRSSTLPEEAALRCARIESVIEVSMKTAAASVVAFESRVAEPRGPNAVCDPMPPKAPARSAALPLCNNTTTIRKKHTMTWINVKRMTIVNSSERLSRFYFWRRAATRLQYKLKAVTLAGAAHLLRRSCPFLALSAALAGPPASTNSSEALETVLSGSFAPALPASRDRAAVLNWNIDRGKHLDDIKAQIRRQKPDLCIFQEVDLDARRTHRENVAKELAETFGMNYVFAPEFLELSQGTAEDPAYHGQALLTTLAVRASRMIRFQHQSGWWKPRKLLASNVPLLQRRQGGRVALVAELDNGGKPLVVYDLHLESKGTEELRLQQLEEVLDDAKRYATETPIIIAGDLNTFFPRSRLIPRLREAGFRNVLGDRRVKTHVILGELDWMFVRGSIECERGQVLHVHGSDHFPIAVDVRL